jgi:cytochrome c553
VTHSRALIAFLVVVGLFLAVLTQPADLRAQNSNAPFGDPNQGEKIALSCSRCHGDRGISRTPWIPNLAGLSQRAIYKQLDDYRSLRRRPEWYMAGIAQALSLQDSADVSAYYAAQTNRSVKPIERGDSLQVAAACGACHNARNGAAPKIAGQQPQYLEIQLSLFAQGIRSNDRNEVMRKIAGQLTLDQIRQISESFGRQSH